ncbi:CheR family methyltransferase [Luteolibacter marinus]|uniref:CheR family methyltransferase n=1 Tax=Luteolibacter marinus TaxID=2776705 RepID=UPI001867C3A5
MAPDLGTPPVPYGTPVRDLMETEVHDPVDLLFVNRVLRTAGLRPEGYRTTPLVRRIPACLRAVRAGSKDAALEMIVDHPAKLQTAVNALLIGTTSFFRDTATFSHLADDIVPRLAAEARLPRVWSVACSDGSELVSVALLFARHGAASRGRFLGTDCRPSAVASAKRGIYTPEAVAALPADLGERFFENSGKGRHLIPAISSRIVWKVSDVLSEMEPGLWDLILCRNLAIYLNPASTRQLWQQLHDSLSPGGHLVVGKAENPQLPGLERTGPCIFRKNSNFQS